MKHLLLLLLGINFYCAVQGQSLSFPEGNKVGDDFITGAIEQQLPETAVYTTTPCDMIVVGGFSYFPPLPPFPHLPAGVFLDGLTVYRGWDKTEVWDVLSGTGDLLGNHQGTPPYTYRWWRNGNLSGNTNNFLRDNITIYPPPVSQVKYEVEITDAAGCKAKKAIMISIKDVRCMRNGHPVKGEVVMCLKKKNPKGKDWEGCVKVDKIVHHMTKGYNLGACPPDEDEQPQITPGNNRLEQGEPESQLRLEVSPNPSYSGFRLQIHSTNANDKAMLNVFDKNGTLMEQRTVWNGQLLQIGAGYRQGIYYAEVVQGKEKASIRLVKQ